MFWKLAMTVLQLNVVLPGRVLIEGLGVGDVGNIVLVTEKDISQED